MIKVHQHGASNVFRSATAEMPRTRGAESCRPTVVLVGKPGNGRVSRLLTLLALYQHDYRVGRYLSLERLVEEVRGV